MRTFADTAAVRAETPLLLGIVGPSSSGKTFSALRLATGIQRVTGGEIFGIDSEACRMKHYAPQAAEPLRPGLFSFRHVEFGEPFGPADYLAAIEHCVRKGAKVIVIDSYSHVHEGIGGLLEMHQAEVKRLQPIFKSEAKANMPAWAVPKQEHRRLVNRLLQMKCHFIFCFRAQEKLNFRPGQDPEPMGYMPIAPKGFVFELTAKFLLMPGARGVATWKSEYRGEREMMKQPDQFAELFAKHGQLNEELGEGMARWAAGSAGSVAPAAPKPAPAPGYDVAPLIARYEALQPGAVEALAELELEAKAAWPSIKQGKAALDAARKAAAARVEPPVTDAT